MSAVTKSQKEAQETSDSGTEWAAEIKQLIVSRAREETVVTAQELVGEPRVRLDQEHLVQGAC